MGKSVYDRELTRFKRSEQPEVVLLVANDKDYISIVVAWTNSPIRRKRRLTKHRGTSASDTWEWLWENAQYSKDDLMARSEVPPKRFESKLTALIANRVLYPDGAINSFVRRYLREKVLKLLGAKPKAAQKSVG